LLQQAEGNAVVIFNKGLTVTFAAYTESHYSVLLTGKIQDNNIVYVFNGTIVYESSGVQQDAFTLEPAESVA